MIDIDNVTFAYGDSEENSIENITLHAEGGEAVLICGSSGCGKTTVTRLINGLIPSYNEGRMTGRVRVCGMDTQDTPLYELSKKTGSVFQNPKAQFFNLDSDSELAFGPENNGVDPEEIKERMDRTVKSLRIERLTGRNIFSMSGGEKQSLAFASAHTMEPEIYVLDEPSANLDEEACDVLREQIAAIKAAGKTIIIAEHRIAYLKDIADRYIYMEAGRIVKEFTKEAFLALSDEERHRMGLRSMEHTDRMFTDAPPSGGLEIRGLSCGRGGRTVFSGVSFTASPGRILGITGHNGTGKTTLARCICGLLKEREGRVLLDGRPLRRKERSRSSYMIMQDVDHQLFGDSVWNECTMSEGSPDEGAIEDILDDLDLLPMRERHPATLSGGQKQRLAIAAGRADGKKIMIFDEPTSGLDYGHMMTVGRMIRETAGRGHIVIVITHDREFLDYACDEVYSMDGHR